MGLNIITLGSSKTYTNQVALGIGNMRVEGGTVYFTILETGEEVSVTIPTPADGVSVVDIEINANNELIFHMSDGTEKVAGQIEVINGEDGFSPTATVTKTGDIVTITIVDKNGTTTAQIKEASIEPYDDTVILNKVSELDTELDTKANSADVYTKTEIDGLIPEEYDDTELSEKLTNLEAIMEDKADKTDLENLATETYVAEKIVEAQLDGSDVDLTGLATKDELAAKANATHTHVLADITDYEAPDLSDYALKIEIPSTDGLVTEENLSTTLADYAKSEDIIEYDDTVLTERIGSVETALDGKADTSDIPDVSNFVEKEEGKGLFGGSYNDLTNKPTIPSIDGLVSEETLNTTLADYTKTVDLPNEYDDTALSNRVTAIEINIGNHTIKSDVPENAVFTDTLYDDTELKIELTEAIAIAKQEAIKTVLGENVEADFDTLQEVAAWIQSDTTNSVELITRVTANENNIEDILDGTSVVPKAEDTNTLSGLSVGELVKTTDLSNYLPKTDIVTTLDVASTDDQVASAKLVYDSLIHVVEPPVMTGATISTAGTEGLVPAPKAGSNHRVLQSTGDWIIPALYRPLSTVETITSGSSITVSSVGTEIWVFSSGGPGTKLIYMATNTANGVIWSQIADLTGADDKTAYINLNIKQNSPPYSVTITNNNTVSGININFTRFNLYV